MLFLMLDNSTHYLSVALCQDRNIITQVNLQNVDYQHSILSILDSFIQQGHLAALTQLQCIACGIGPGGYTGTRIACSISQALSLALAIPTIAFSSLLAIAMTAYAQTEADVYTVFWPANIEYVYYGIYALPTCRTIAEGICRKNLHEAQALCQGHIIGLAALTTSTLPSHCMLEVVHLRDHVRRMIVQAEFTSTLLPQYYQQL